MARPAILSFLRSETSSRDPFEVRGRPLAVNEKRVVLGVEDSFLDVVPAKPLTTSSESQSEMVMNSS
jgi:hypothetical protein